jgi:hypothetical protein
MSETKIQKNKLASPAPFPEKIRLQYITAALKCKAGSLKSGFMRERILYIDLTHNVFVRTCGKTALAGARPDGSPRSEKQRHPVIILYK